MKEKRLLIVGVTVATILAVVAWLLYGETDEAKLRARLSLIATTVTKERTEEKLAFIGKARTLDDLFTPDCVVTVGDPMPDMKGRGKVKGAYLQATRMIGYYTVSFHDVAVEVAQDGQSATSLQTVKVLFSQAGNRPSLDAREVRMRWEKVQGTWCVAHIELVRIFE